MIRSLPGPALALPLDRLPLRFAAMIHPVLWYRDAEGVYSRHAGAPPELGAALLGWGVLDDAGALTVREILDAQIGDGPDATALAVAAWRRQHPAMD